MKKHKIYHPRLNDGAIAAIALASERRGICEARVEGPLFSIQAHGQMGKTIVYTRSRGQNVVRELVIPRNPQTAGQGQERTVLKVIGAMNSRINAGQVGKGNGLTQTPLQYLKSVTVAPRVWNSELLKRGFINGYTTFSADIVAYAALQQSEKDAWTAFNTAFANSFEDVLPATGYTPTTTGVEVSFCFARGLARAGYLTVVPSTAPPAWDNT